MSGLQTVVEYLSIFISIISIAVVVYGTAAAFVSFMCNEAGRARGRFNRERLRELRVDLGSYILLSLELLIASDILKTISEPGLTELYILGGIVVLRTVLSVFLNREISEIEQSRRELERTGQSPDGSVE